jgi:hypothetical protein
VTIRLASDGPQTVRADTIGTAWLAVAGRILAEGVESRYDGLPVREISLVTLVVEYPAPADEIIARHAEPERLAWMHANFTDHARVAALGDAASARPDRSSSSSRVSRPTEACSPSIRSVSSRSASETRREASGSVTRPGSAGAGARSKPRLAWKD